MKNFLKGQLPLFKLAGVVFLFVFIISLFSLILVALNSVNMALAIIVDLVFLGCCGLFSYVMASSSASTDFNVLKNAHVRERNGDEADPVKKMQGYRVWRGYVAGLLAAVPLIILVIIGASVGQVLYKVEEESSSSSSSGESASVAAMAETEGDEDYVIIDGERYVWGPNGAETLLRVVYGVFYVPLYTIFQTTNPWAMLYGVVFLSLLTGLGYQIKGIRLHEQYKKLTHGDKLW